MIHQIKNFFKKDSISQFINSTDLFFRDTQSQVNNISEVGPYSLFKNLEDYAFKNSLFRHSIKRIKESSNSNNTLLIELNQKISPKEIILLENEINHYFSSVYTFGSKGEVFENILSYLSIMGVDASYITLNKNKTGIDHIDKISPSLIYFDQGKNGLYNPYIYTKTGDKFYLNTNLFNYVTLETFNCPYGIPPAIASLSDFKAVGYGFDSVEAVLKQFGTQGLLIYYIGINNIIKEAKTLHGSDAQAFKAFVEEEKAKLKKSINDSIKGDETNQTKNSFRKNHLEWS